MDEELLAWAEEVWRDAPPLSPEAIESIAIMLEEFRQQDNDDAH